MKFKIGDEAYVGREMAEPITRTTYTDYVHVRIVSMDAETACVEWGWKHQSGIPGMWERKAFPLEYVSVASLLTEKEMLEAMKTA